MKTWEKLKREFEEVKDEVKKWHKDSGRRFVDTTTVARKKGYKGQPYYCISPRGPTKGNYKMEGQQICCPTCEGAGKTPQYSNNPLTGFRAEITCDLCKGLKKVWLLYSWTDHENNGKYE